MWYRLSGFRAVFGGVWEVPCSWVVLAAFRTGSEAAMPQPYSADLRERVLLAGEAGLPPAAVARRFGVALSTVYLWGQQARRAEAAPSRTRAVACRGSTRRARRLCERWPASGTIARWTNTSSS